MENKNYMKFVIEVLQHNALTLQEFLDFALDKAIELTESKIGYIYHYSEEKKQFVLNTWSKDVMKECNVMNPETVYDLEKTGFWGEVVRQKKDLILNDFEAPHSQKKGYPEGHVKLLRFMSIPIFKENEIIAVVGMANKDTDYTDDDVLKLRLMMDAVWKVVDHKKAEEDFRENEKRYHLIAENMGNIITMLDMDFNFTFATPNVEKVIGFTPEEYVNLSLAETLLPVSLQEVIDRKSVV